MTWVKKTLILCCGSGIRCLFDLDPGSGAFLTRIRDRGSGTFYPDPGSDALLTRDGKAMIWILTLNFIFWRKFKRYRLCFRSDVAGVWSCVCREGWDGKDCATRLETQCADGLDNDAGQHVAPPPCPCPSLPVPICLALSYPVRYRYWPASTCSKISMYMHMIWTIRGSSVVFVGRFMELMKHFEKKVCLRCHSW
jgi:hypothetical protein